ncbi:hypothetical protein ACJZ2D_004392 [Fusarium nematophilum]
MSVTSGHYLVNDGYLTQSDTLDLQPSYPSEPLEKLRSRYNQDGYLFVKGLLPRNDVLKCREAYFSFLSPTKVLKPGTGPVDGIYDEMNNPADYPNLGTGKPPDRDTAALFLQLAEKAHTEKWYLDFSRHAALQQFVEKLTGWGDDTLLLPRSLLRNNTPVNKAIGVHYDQIFLRYGDPSAVTAWIPIGDISEQGGSLIYLEESDALGKEIEVEFTERAKQSGLSDEEQHNPFNANMMSNGFLADGPLHFGREHGRRWLVTAYEAGDVVFHKPHMRWLQPFSFGDGL